MAANDGSIFEAPETTEDEIIHATYEALCDHGYADLTIQRIADHFPKSKSLIYNHYDGKDELLLEFLAFMLEEFKRSIPGEVDGDPRARLEGVLDDILDPSPPERLLQFEAAMVELRAQAVNDERYRTAFARHDRFFSARLVEGIQAGIDDGSFRDADPEQVADFVITVLAGVRYYRATRPATDVTAIREGLDAYLESMLYAQE